MNNFYQKYSQTEYLFRYIGFGATNLPKHINTFQKTVSWIILAFLSLITGYIFLQIVIDNGSPKARALGFTSRPIPWQIVVGHLSYSLQALLLHALSMWENFRPPERHNRNEWLNQLMMGSARVDIINKYLGRKQTWMASGSANNWMLIFYVYILALIYWLASMLDRLQHQNSDSIAETSFIVWTVLVGLWSAVASNINHTFQAQFVHVCQFISAHFDEVSHHLTALFDNSHRNRQKWNFLVSAVHLKHSLVCDMLFAGDQYWQKYLFIYYSLFTPSTVLLLYSQLFDMHWSMRFIYTLWSAIAVTQITYISIAAARVHSSAHRPYRWLHNLAFHYQDFPIHILLFSQRLSSFPIGFSFMGIFVVTSRIIGSVFTAVLSYFIFFIDHR